MGQAKQRASMRADEHKALEETLCKLGVDTAEFGFYDQEAFVQNEQRDSQFLEKYAVWVDSRARDPEYEARTRIIVPKLANFMADLFEREGLRRSCVHVSSMIPRILDRMGIWSFGLQGSFVSKVTGTDLWRGQASCDIADFEAAELGHAWVAAPPFTIIDATIRLQNPPDDPMNDYLPEVVAVEDVPLTKPRVEDIVSHELRQVYAQREGRVDNRLHHRLAPQLSTFSRHFPSREVKMGKLELRYIPLGVRISDLPLEEINGGAEKLTGEEVWQKHIVPNFADHILSGT